MLTTRREFRLCGIGTSRAPHSSCGRIVSEAKSLHQGKSQSARQTSFHLHNVLLYKSCKPVPFWHPRGFVRTPPRVSLLLIKYYHRSCVRHACWLALQRTTQVIKLLSCPAGNLPCDRPMPIETGHTADAQTEQYLVPCLREQENPECTEALQCIVCNSCSAVVES